MGGFSVRSCGMHDSVNSDPRSFDDADRMLHYRQDVTRRAVNSRRLSANTVLVRNDDGSIAVRLHGTAVVTWTADGWVTLSTGTWNTPTTRNRIARHLPAGCRVSVDKRVPYVFVARKRRYDRNAPCPIEDCTSELCDVCHRGRWIDDGNRTVTLSDGLRFRVSDPLEMVCGGDVSLSPPRRPFGTYSCHVQRATGRQWSVQAWHDEEYGDDRESTPTIVAPRVALDDHAATVYRGRYGTAREDTDAPSEGGPDHDTAAVWRARDAYEALAVEEGPRLSWLTG